MAEDVTGGALREPHPSFLPWRTLVLLISFLESVTVFSCVTAEGAPAISSSALQELERLGGSPRSNNLRTAPVPVSSAAKSTASDARQCDGCFRGPLAPQSSGSSVERPGRKPGRDSSMRRTIPSAQEGERDSSSRRPRISVPGGNRRILADLPRRDRPSAYSGGYYTHSPNYDDTRGSPFATPGGQGGRDTFWAKRENFIFAFITLLATAIISETLHQVRVRREVRRRKRARDTASSSTSSTDSSAWSSLSRRSAWLGRRRWAYRRRDRLQRDGRRRYLDEYYRYRDRYSDDDDFDDRLGRSVWARSHRSGSGRLARSPSRYRKSSYKRYRSRDSDDSRESDSDKDGTKSATVPLQPRARRNKSAKQNAQPVLGEAKADDKAGKAISDAPGSVDPDQLAETVAKSTDTDGGRVPVSVSGETPQPASELPSEPEPILVGAPVKGSGTGQG